LHHGFPAFAAAEYREPQCSFHYGSDNGEYKAFDSASVKTGARKIPAAGAFDQKSSYQKLGNHKKDLNTDIATRGTWYTKVD